MFGPAAFGLKSMDPGSDLAAASELCELLGFMSWLPCGLSASEAARRIGQERAYLQRDPGQGHEQGQDPDQGQEQRYERLRSLTCPCREHQRRLNQLIHELQLLERAAASTDFSEVALLPPPPREEPLAPPPWRPLWAVPETGGAAVAVALRPGETWWADRETVDQRDGIATGHQHSGAIGRWCEQRQRIIERLAVEGWNRSQIARMALRKGKAYSNGPYSKGKGY